MKVKRLTAALLAAAITVSSIAPEAFAEIGGAGGTSTVNESTDPASGGSDKTEEPGKTVSSSEPGEGESDYTYNALDDGTIEITGYSGSAENIVIPAQIDGKSVTRIGNNAFEKSSAKEIVIPDSVTDIEQYAFEGCTSLSDITLPDSLTSIGLSAFESCTALTDIALPDSLTYIDGFAFANCTSLKTVTVPASVTFIGGWAFGYYFEDGNIDARVAFDDFTINYTKHTAGHLYAVENGFTDEGCLIYTVNADGTLEIDKYVGNDTIFEIPAEIGGKKVTSIGYKAFENRTSLTSVTIPDSVTDIGFQAFHNCTSLKSVTIPASVTTIDNYAFGYFYDANKETKIDGFTINYTKNTAGHLYAAQNGFTDEACLINELQDDGTVIITKYAGNDTVFEIPSEIDGKKVTGIGNRAFQNSTSLTNATIPDGVTHIDECAFQGCSSLTDIALPDSLAIIDSYAFNNCAMLTSITIPNGVTRIEWATFYGCSALTDLVLPDSVTYIGYKVFFDCPSLKTVTIPASVTTIDNYAFGYFYDANKETKIDGFTINYTKNTAGHLYAAQNGFTDEACLINELQDDGTVIITKYAGNDTVFEIPSEIDGKKVTGIGNRAFQNSTSLTNATIPDGVTHIDECAFQGCSSLTDIALPDSLAIIDSYAFNNCAMLTSITIPNGVTRIEWATFYGCSALTDLVLPDSVTYIGYKVFFDCPSLKTVTIPASVTDIGEYAFGYHDDDNWNLAKIDGFKINYTKNTWGHYYAKQNGFSDEPCLVAELNEDGTTLKISKYAGNDTEYVIPSEIDGKKVTSIGNDAFRGNTSLISVTIPGSIKDIGDNAFSDCSSLESVTISDGVERILYRAFYNCTSLKTVTVPASVTYIDNNALGYYSDDGGININKIDGFTINYTKYTHGHLYATANGFTDEGYLYFNILDDDTVEIKRYIGNDTVFEIPAEIDGKQITSIGNYAFLDRKSLTSVTIPDSVTIIRFQAFHNCPSLKTVTIPASVTTIGDYAFGYFDDEYQKTKIDGFKINYTKNTAGHRYAFENGFTDETCLLTEIQEDGTVKITKYCGNDTSFVIPAEIDGKPVTSIGYRAFADSTLLTSITIPDSVKYIEMGAFASCTSLADIVLPASLITIDTEAFRNCTSLTSVTIPDGVTDIGSYAFASCSALTKISLPDSVVVIGDRAFFDCPLLKSVTVPASVTDIGEYAFGYHYDDDWYYTKTDGFKIYCYGGTAGEQYAKDNGFEYKILECKVHKFGEWTITKEASCTKDGEKVRICPVCNKTETETIPATGHKEVIDKAVEATCTKTGLTEGIHCSVCDAIIKAQEVVPAKGHTEVVDKAVAATCTKTGLTEGKHCSVCDALIKAQETVPAKGHKYIDTVVKPTYTAKGYTLHKCSVCGNSYKDTYTAKLTLAKVTAVKLGGRAADALRINWSKNASADGYIVEMYQGNKWVRVAKITSNNTTTLRKAGLKAGTAYKFRVKAYKMSGKTAVYGAYSATVAARTNPSVIKGAKLTGRAADALRINWTKNASADGYIVEMYQNGKWGRVAKITNNSTTTFRKAGLKASTVYKFRVRAYKMSGKTALYGNYSATVTARTNPSIVKGVKIGGKAKDALRVNWTKNTSAQGYIVEMYKGGKWVRVAKITNSNTTTFRKAGLAKNSAYKFRVRAYHMSGKTALYGNYGSVSGKTAAK